MAHTSNVDQTTS